MEAPVEETAQAPIVAQPFELRGFLQTQPEAQIPQAEPAISDPAPEVPAQPTTFADQTIPEAHPTFADQTIPEAQPTTFADQSIPEAQPTFPNQPPSPTK